MSNAVACYQKVVMKHKIENMLVYWSDWALSGPGFGLGYQCNLAWLAANGGHHTPAIYPKVLPSNPEAEKMELMLAQLKNHLPQAHRAITQHYLSRPAIKEITAKKLGMSLITLNEKIKDGKNWLVAFLCGHQLTI